MGEGDFLKDQLLKGSGLLAERRWVRERGVCCPSLESHCFKTALISPVEGFRRNHRSTDSFPSPAGASPRIPEQNSEQLLLSKSSLPQMESKTLVHNTNPPYRESSPLTPAGPHST